MASVSDRRRIRQGTSCRPASWAAPAALAGDDLPGVAFVWLRAHQDGLEDAAGADGIGQAVERLLRHGPAGLEGAGAEGFDWQEAHRMVVGVGGGSVAQQGGQAAAEPWSAVFCGHGVVPLRGRRALWSGSRVRNSSARRR